MQNFLYKKTDLILIYILFLILPVVEYVHMFKKARLKCCPVFRVKPTGIRSLKRKKKVRIIHLKINWIRILPPFYPIKFTFTFYFDIKVNIIDFLVFKYWKMKNRIRIRPLLKNRIRIRNPAACLSSTQRAPMDGSNEENW